MLKMTQLDYLMNEVHDLLYRFGVTASYVGFFHTSYAVWLYVQQPQRILMTTKWLYPEVAKQYNTTWKAVERNVRTVISVAWRNNPELMMQIARRPLQCKPNAAQFISILAEGLPRDQYCRAA